MAAYYNEIEPYCCEWLKNLMAAGLIPDGHVDSRPIQEVQPEDLSGFTQCHFFAGLGGWAYAARLAGWPDDEPIWSGSPPCQPFSIAGKRKGTADERHLWPAWFRLIQKRRPPVVFGEQVAAAIARRWMDGVADDMEGEGYAFAAAVLPACSVGAPHRRDRLWFVAHPNNSERGANLAPWHVANREDARRKEANGNTKECSNFSLAHANGSNEYWRSGPLQVGWNCVEGEASDGVNGERTKWLIKPGLPLLVNGISGRVGRLCAYGNAIVPQVAAEFIKASIEAIRDLES